MAEPGTTEGTLSEFKDPVRQDLIRRIVDKYPSIAISPRANVIYLWLADKEALNLRANQSPDDAFGDRMSRTGLDIPGIYKYTFRHARSRCWTNNFAQIVASNSKNTLERPDPPEIVEESAEESTGFKESTVERSDQRRIKRSASQASKGESSSRQARQNPKSRDDSAAAKREKGPKGKVSYQGSQRENKITLTEFQVLDRDQKMYVVTKSTQPLLEVAHIVPLKLHMTSVRKSLHQPWSWL